MIKTKVCNMCKLEKPATEFSFRNKERKTLISKCIPCQREYLKVYNKNNFDRLSESKKAKYESIKNTEEFKKQGVKYRKDNKEYLSQSKKDYHSTLGGRFVYCKSMAKRRNIEFKLTKEEFSTFWQQPCSICGCEIKTIGLDRIDSDGIYEISNVRSACTTCNLTKHILSDEEFMLMLNKIADNLGLK